MCGQLIYDDAHAYCSNRCQTLAAQKLPEQIKKEVAALMKCYRRQEWTRVD